MDHEDAELPAILAAVIGAAAAILGDEPAQDAGGEVRGRLFLISH